MGRPRADSGFTLLEVMVALAVVGGLLVTLLYTLNYHMDVALRHEAVTVARMLGKQKLVELEAAPLNSEGAFPEPYADYSYTTVYKPSSYPGVSELSVTVVSGKEKVVIRELVKGALSD